MGELVSGIQREIKPVKNAIPTVAELSILKAKDTFSRLAHIFGSKREETLPNSMQAMALVGFASLIPDQITASGILKNPKRIAALNAIEQYFVILNDRKDFEGSERQDIGAIIDQIHNIENARKAVLENTFAALPESEQEWVRNNTQTAIREVEFVEDWIRQRQAALGLSLSDVDTYRTMVNAVCEVTGAAIIFGAGYLQDRVAPIEGQIDIQKVVDKYSWITSIYPKNDLERALMIAHNLAAAGQIVDDRKGIDIDEVLKVPTYARAALKIAAGDVKAARNLLDSKEREYKQRAYDLGTGKITQGVITEVVTLAESAHQGIAKTGRRSKLARKILGRLHLGLREEAYMRRKI